MEDGYLSDAKGRRVDFRNTLIVMTSNVGANLIQGHQRLGFAITTDEDANLKNEYQAMKTRIMDALKKTFRPEFINRLDGVMVFRNLNRQEIGQIVELELLSLRNQLREQEMKLNLTEEARLAIAEQGYDPDYGARPLRRVIQNKIQDPLSEDLLSQRFVPGDTIQVDFRETYQDDGELVKDFVFDAVDHKPVEAVDTETTEAVMAMLQ
jgi:ATP-dependent Clp protease ATP-binding subunit ClpC